MRRRRPATASSSLAPGKEPAVDHHLAGLGDGVVPAAAADLADVGRRRAEQGVGLVAEVGRVQGEDDRGGVLDGRDALPGPAAVPRAAPDDHVGDEQSPFGDADRQRSGLRDQARVALDEPALDQDAGTEGAAALLVGDEVEHHVAGRRAPGAGQDAEGADGRRDPALHVRAAPPVEAAIDHGGVERRAGPELAETGTTSRCPFTMSVGGAPAAIGMSDAGQ